LLAVADTDEFAARRRAVNIRNGRIIATVDVPGSLEEAAMEVAPAQTSGGMAVAVASPEAGRQRFLPAGAVQDLPAGTHMSAALDQRGQLAVTSGQPQLPLFQLPTAGRHFVLAVNGWSLTRQLDAPAVSYRLERAAGSSPSVRFRFVAQLPFGAGSANYNIEVVVGERQMEEDYEEEA
jgi:hypothetical protein